MHEVAMGWVRSLDGNYITRICDLYRTRSNIRTVKGRTLGQTWYVARIDNITMNCTFTQTT
jgi:hypothetical protein